MSDVKNKRVNIYIDQASAEDALTKLQSKADGFNSKIQKCREQQTKLLEEIKKSEAAGKDVSKLETKYNNLNTQINATNKSLKDNDAAMAKVKQQIDSGVSPSFNQLSRYVSKLHNELKSMSQDTPGYAAKFNEFEKSSQQLHKLKDSMNVVQKTQKSWMSNVGGIAAGVLIGTTVQAGLQALGGYLTGIVSGNAKLSDSLSDIEKSTGLSAAAVAKLNKELGTIDTRTASSQLREIAVGLGQIGEAANKENVAAIDQIVVALGDEFGGGAREITTTLSVLRNNLQDIKTGDYATDVSHIGNALNVLGAEGLATAPVVTDIANRIAGIGQTFKLSSGQILGVAATFQELGISTERGSTAITKLFQKIASEPEKFAKVAGMEIKAFTNLVNTDMLGAFDAVAAGAKKAGANNVVFAKILKELDADGSGAGEVISKLGTNHDLLAKKVDTATTALKGNGSITDEFSKKNNNLAAQLEKLGKNIDRWFSNSTLTNFFKDMVGVLADVTAKTKSTTEKFDDQLKTVVNLETKTRPLIERYDELTKKSEFLGGATKLSKEEQGEMKNIIDEVAKAIPSAISQVDAYGNAIAISTSRVREFITSESDRLKFLNKGAISDLTKQLKDLEKQSASFERGKALADAGNLQVYAGGQSGKSRTANQEEVAQFREDYRNYISTLNGIKAEIKRLNGDALKEQIDANKKEADEREAARLKAIADAKKPGAGATNPFGEEDKKAQELLKKLKEFKFELEQVGKDGDQKEVDRIRKKYDELITETAAHGVKLIGLEAEKNRAIAFLIEKDRKEAEAKRKKEFEEVTAAEYDNQQKLSAEFYERKKQEEAQKYADGLITKKQFESNALAIDVSAKQMQLLNAQDYAANVKKAEADVLVFKKQLTTQEIADAIKKREILVENEKLLAELKKKAAITSLENKISNAKPGSNEYKDASKNLRAEKLKQEIEEVEKQEADYRQRGIQFTNEFELEKERIRRKYKIDEKKEKEEQLVKDITDSLHYFQQVLGIIDQFNQARNQKETAALNKELKQNDERKKSIQKLINNKTLTEIEGRRQIAAIDKEEEIKKEALAKSQFERNKRMQIAQAIVNGAMAITSTLAARPGPLDVLSLGAFRAINIAIAVATTAAQIATISSQKFSKGALLSGPSHSQGGMPIINPNTGHKVAEIEGGEAILSKNTVANNRPLINALLNSSINQNGKTISWQQPNYQPINFSGISQSMQVLKYASGGLFTNQTTTQAPAQQFDTSLMVEALRSNQAVMMNLMETNKALHKRLQSPIDANVSLKKLDDAYIVRSSILKEATP